MRREQLGEPCRDSFCVFAFDSNEPTAHWKELWPQSFEVEANLLHQRWESRVKLTVGGREHWATKRFQVCIRHGNRIHWFWQLVMAEEVQYYNATIDYYARTEDCGQA